MTKNLVSWFEIPVANMARAKKFYESVFEVEITVHDLGGLQMGWFPMNPNSPGATGSLMQHHMYEPSSKAGVLVYFLCEGINDELKRVKMTGGSILKAKTEIGGNQGFMALLLDSEGNRIGLRSVK